MLTTFVWIRIQLRIRIQAYVILIANFWHQENIAQTCPVKL
jgi:hypothetical protein